MCVWCGVTAAIIEKEFMNLRDREHRRSQKGKQYRNDIVYSCMKFAFF